MSRGLPQAARVGPALPYFNLLTALRGLAVLAIVPFHMCHAFRIHTEEPHPLLGFLMPAINLGWYGVDVFFLISGYGLAAKLSAGKPSQGGRGAFEFARNRVWRIYPVYWACCLIALGLAMAASHFNHLDWRLEFPGTPGGVVASALLIEPFTGTPPLLPIVTWTLNCELGFYALVALGIVLRPRVSDTRLIVAAFALALASILTPMPLLGWLFAFWPQFGCGLLVFAAIERRRRGEAGTFRTVLAGLVVLGATAAMDGHTRIAVTAAVGLGLVAVWPADAILQQQAPVRWLARCGQLSYPLFLIHVPVVSRVLNLSRRAIPADSLAFLLVIAAALILSIMVAWIIHRLIERPLLAWAKNQPAPAI